MAQLRGKLSTDIWLESEDLLTSAVFGTLKNLESAFTTELLSMTQPLEGSAPPTLRPPLTWYFWPWWDTCEPDIVIEDERNLCVIEAKLYSEFGEDMGTGTQLRREWRDGLRRSREAGKELWLVTITNHGSIPEEAIQRQLARTSADLSRVCWLSWLEIGRFLRGLNSELVRAWRNDLLELLSRMGLAPFDGFGEITAYSRLLPGHLPWTDGVVLGEEHLERVGFGAVVELARAVTTRSVMSWRLAPGVGIGNVGFGPAAAAAREWHQKGGYQWRPRLT